VDNVGGRTSHLTLGDRFLRGADLLGCNNLSGSKNARRIDKRRFVGYGRNDDPVCL